MYAKNIITKSSLTGQCTIAYEGESIENKIHRIVNNKEPIKDGAPIIYTDRKDGVNPAYDIRTDRFEIAIDATDKISKTYIAQREQRLGEKTYDTMTPEQQKEFHTKFPNNKHTETYKSQQSNNKSGA